MWGWQGPKSISFTTLALCFPDEITNKHFAVISCVMPIVIALVGTSSIELKKREFASIVALERDTTCVFEPKGVKGSLKPTCPFGPKPIICKSRGFFAKTSLYFFHSSTKFVATPLGI